MNFQRILGGLVLFVSVVACTSSPFPASAPNRPGAVRLLVSGDRFSPGDGVSIVLRNGSSERIGFNICVVFVDLEVSDGATWRKVDASLARRPGSGCTLILRSLSPSADAAGKVYLPATLSSGTYRLKTDIEYLGDGKRVQVTSAGFQVA